MTSKLIVALDFDNQINALKLIDSIEPASCALKVGSEMFTHFGNPFIKQLIARNFNVFLDLKFHDIPNTVANACKAAADLGVWMMNVHASGGLHMMQAAKKALESYGNNGPILIAVTVLTSLSEMELTSIGINSSLLDQVKKLALLAKQAGLDGVVSSAYEVKSIKEECGARFITVTPGIRPTTSNKNDQTRVVTPKDAVILGSDYLVIGRPITEALDPAAVITEIHGSINQGSAYDVSTTSTKPASKNRYQQF
ncbi:MAG: orotidine-5'-phosphate decarboxylase [Legionellales bacterium]